MASATSPEDTMATAQELAVRDKKELVSKEEKNVPAAIMFHTQTSTRPTKRSAW
jgi:hypothetical protein